jgi:hypothetical protein
MPQGIKGSASLSGPKFAGPTFPGPTFPEPIPTILNCFNMLAYSKRHAQEVYFIREMEGKHAKMGDASSTTSMNWSFGNVYLSEQWCVKVIFRQFYVQK